MNPNQIHYFHHIGSEVFYFLKAIHTIGMTLYKYISNTVTYTLSSTCSLSSFLVIVEMVVNNIEKLLFQEPDNPFVGF